MKQYFDPSVSDYQMSHIAPSAMADTARFPARETREILIKRGIFENHFIKYLYRPFDIRWLYWEPITKLLDEKRLEYFAHVFSRNIWIALAQKNRKAFDPPCLATIHAARHLIERGANLFPLRLRDNTSQGSLFGEPTNGIHDNISDAGREYLSKLNSTTDDLFYYCVGILYALPYQVENAGALRHDWPRIPLPAERDTLFVSAALGRQIAALLDPEAPVPGVTAGQIRVEMRVIGVPARIDGGSLHAEELAVTAGWGHAGQGGVTMPARGKAIEREYTAKERVAITAGASALGLSPEAAFACLGETTFDIYLNERACWRNVPARAWEYRLGGYQVIKKWLSYRESSLLTRALTPEEAFYVADMSRRITALLLLAPALDDIYRQVTSETYAWSAKTNPFEGC